jgi:hypothetical protein
MKSLGVPVMYLHRRFSAVLEGGAIRIIQNSSKFGRRAVSNPPFRTT